MTDAMALIALGFRTVSGGKGADTADAQRQTELNMQQQAFAQQQQIMNAINQATQQYIGGRQGYAAPTMAAMTSQFLNNNSQTFNNAGNQVRAALGARGEGTGQNPVGGSYGSGIASLMGQQAQSQSQGLLGLNIQNAQQGINNMWNALNLRAGNAATLTGTQGVAGSAASSALSSYIQGMNSGPLESALSGFGQGLGGGLGIGVGGGIGKALGGVFSSTPH